MSIRCGHCGNRHETTAQVRACSGQAPAPAPASGLPEGREPEVLGINRPRPSGGQAAAEGVYRVGDRIFRVVIKTGKTHAVAEEMINGKFVYAKGWVFRLKPAQRMTLDEAKAWGRAEVRCVRCGITLEKAESRAAGIGPVCATKV